MEKDLRKSYEILDLAYTATEKDIKKRKEEILEDLNRKNSKNYENDMEKVERAYNLIIENLKQNGYPEEEDRRFQVSGNSLLALTVTMFIFAILCVSSCLLF